MIVNLALLALMVADFGGQWRATVPMGPRSVEFVLDLKQSGQTIGGTVSLSDEVLTIESGRIQDDTISFSALASNGGKLVRLPFNGKLDGSELRFQMEGASVTATRIVSTAEELRIGRLAGLFRTWGTIKFFHPFLAYRPIDWDSALVKTIPKVEAAKSNDAYATSVDSMLGELHDPETHVLHGPIKNYNAAAGNFRRLVRSGFYPPAGPGFFGYYADWEAAENVAPYVMDLPGDVRVVMRTAESATSFTTIKTDEQSYGTSIPSRELRLLALARFWSTIRYFYGYSENIADWDAALPELLPRFESAANWRDYVFTIARLASRTNDSHTFAGEIWRQLGAMPGLEIWPVQGKSVVNHVGAAVKGIERGDVILSVNGEPVERRLQSLLEIYPHSTKQAGLLMANQFLLAGDEPELKVRVLKGNGAETEVTLARNSSSGTVSSGPNYEIMASGLGYIDLQRLMAADVDRAFDAVINAPGLILDMRGYPDNIFAAVGSRLTERKTPAAIIRRRVWHGPDPALSVIRQQTQYIYPSDKPKYKGKIAVLIDARAVSRAEHMCLFLEQAAKVTFIGSPTKGADGDVTRTILPGGIEINFAAQEIRHADGRPLQRVGILPDIWVEPTIAGIRDGRNEVLAKAVEFLTAPKQ